MRRIGRADATRPLLSVESERIRADLVAPERFIEAGAEAVGARMPLARMGLVLPHRGQLRRASPRGVGVALHLAERDGPLGKRAVGMKDGVVRILPSLLHEAVLAVARVLEK